MQRKGMNKMKIKFFCNLERAYMSNEDDTTRSNLISELVDTLESLSDNYIEFSFLSSANINSLIKFIGEIQLVLEKKKSKIKLGVQYTENKSYRNGVIDNAFPGVLSQISLDVYQKNFDKIFYADKSSLALEMADETLKEMSPDSEIILLNCIDDGPSPLYSLNTTLKNYLGTTRKRVNSQSY